MTASLQVELFEYVPATAGTVLLRLEGRWHAPAREPLPMPTLVVDDGKRSRRLTALPGPEAAPPQAGPEPPLWRASYPIDATLLDDPRIAFALDAGRGQIVDLPAAAPRGRGQRYSRSSHAELAHERTRRAAAERLADERRRALREAEVAVDRERAARAAATIRADAAEADLRSALAELESGADHARADAAQHARDAEAAAGALAVAQARVRELDEALAAQRRRALEAESAAASTAAEADAALERERARGAEAVATQRALAEEATRARVAAETQAREHEARAADLEQARDELRERLEEERERLRVLQAEEVAESAVEERRRVRELQTRLDAAERKAADADRRLATARGRTDVEIPPSDEELAAQVVAERARADEAQRQLRELAGELVEAAQARTELQERLVDAEALAEANARGAVAVAAGDGPASPPSDGGDAESARLAAELDSEREARRRAEEEARLAIDERAELAAKVTALEEAARARPPAAADPPPAEAEDTADAAPPPSTARSLFGPFGDAGPSDPPTLTEAALGEPPEPEQPTEFDPPVYEDPDPDAPRRSTRWETNEYDVMTFAPPAASVPSRGRRAGAPAGRSGSAAERRRARSQSLDTPSAGASRRRLAMLLGAVVAGGVLLGLKAGGALGVLTLASFS